METYEITIDGQKYRAQANSEEGARIKIQTYISEQKIKDQITDEQAKSGVGDALLSGLTNDEAYKTRWLAEKRFPELLEQGTSMDPYIIGFGLGMLVILLFNKYIFTNESDNDSSS